MSTREKSCQPIMLLLVEMTPSEHSSVCGGVNHANMQYLTRVSIQQQQKDTSGFSANVVLPVLVVQERSSFIWVFFFFPTQSPLMWIGFKSDCFLRLFRLFFGPGAVWSYSRFFSLKPLDFIPVCWYISF